MRAKHIVMFKQQHNPFGTSKMHLSYKWFSLLSVKRGGSVVVDALFIVALIVCGKDETCK